MGAVEYKRSGCPGVEVCV